MSDPARGDIFVVRGENELVALPSQPFPQELHFQDLLIRHPQILAAGADGRKLLLIRREVPIRHGEDGATGWLDHLFVDAQGVLTLVEVKRSADSRIRREVVGQMLDYASNAAFGWPVEMLQAFLQKPCELASKMRLLFVADGIPSDLRRIIEFLNRHMDPMEVLGVEIRRFVGEGFETLLPTVHGRTEESNQRKSVRPSVKWNEQSFFERMQQKPTAGETERARRLLAWAKQCTYVWWGEGPTDGSFVPTEVVNNTKHQVLAVYSGSATSTAYVYLYFQHYKAPFDTQERRLELLSRFNTIDGIRLPTEAITKRPRINLADLSSEALEKLLAVFDWYLAEVRRSAGPS